MADNITLKTYKGGNVTPQDDAIIYETAIPGSGIFKGCEVTYARGNVLHISQGFGMIRGRFFEVYETEIDVRLADVGETLQGRVYIHLDLSNADEPIKILAQAAAELPPLDADVNINYNNSSYDLELAIFTVSSAGLSGLTKVFPTLKAGSGGGGGGGETLTRATSYSVGDAVTAVGAPGWATLVCTQAGTTAAYEPSGYSRITKAGDMVLDGTAVFTARNIIGELDSLISTTGTLEESMQTLDEKVTEMMSSTGLVMKLVSLDGYLALESYSASTIYLCYEDETTKRVTRIFVGEDRVYAAGVKVTYQIDTGYALERTVPDREDAIAAAPPTALEGYTFVGWRQDDQAEKKVLSEFIISSEEPVTLYAVFKKQMTIGLIYADEGISGVSTNKREQFKKMIKDCEDGKIDMVVTKSISRFARNTQDCLQYSRKLKNLGIGIFFEKENINTLDAAGELLFTIMSSLAQEESRSISENCRWGIRTKFKQGVMHLNANHFLGYDKDEKGNLVINEAQAAIVRRVFDEFMNGLNPEVIAAELNSEGIPGCMGEPKWAVSTIMHILENEKYKGDALLQKYYTSDFLSKKSVRNMGQIEQVYVKDSHPPIVDKELWEAVQLEIERRRLFREKHNLQNMGRYTDVQPFTCRVICGKCGAVCWRRTWTRGSRKIRVWQCGKRYQQKGVVGCKSGNLYEKDLEKAFLMAWNGIVENRESFLPAWKKQISEGNTLEKWRAGQMVQLTAEPPLETICPEIVNMVLESVEVHDGGVLHFHFLDGTELEIETEE